MGGRAQSERRDESGSTHIVQLSVHGCKMANPRDPSLFLSQMMAKIEALAAIPGTANTTDRDGNTCLHIAKTPEIVRLLLEAGGSNPRRIKNKDGKTAYEIQTREIREVIDQFVLFCGRFDIASLSAPEHATATSVVLQGIDTFVVEEGEDGVEETKGADDIIRPSLSRNVVIKLMKDREVAQREIKQRQGTDSKHVVVGRIACVFHILPRSFCPKGSRLLPPITMLPILHPVGGEGGGTRRAHGDQGREIGLPDCIKRIELLKLPAEVGF